MSMYRGLIFLLLCEQAVYSRNPFSFGKTTHDEVLAHGVLHDLNVEFNVYCDENECVRVKALENKSPST